jgi:hypothetical protein
MFRGSPAVTPPIPDRIRVAGPLAGWCLPAALGIWLALVVAAPAMADSDETMDTGSMSQEALEEAEKEAPGRFQRIVDAVYGKISSAVEASAQRVDSFFADDRYYADTTETYLRVSGETTFEGGEDNQSAARVRARLDLPGTRERLRLFVEGGDPDEVQDQGARSVPKALEDNDYNVGLESQLPDTGNWFILPAIGVKASSTPDPFVRTRAIRYEKLGDWLMRFSVGAAQYVSDGTQMQTRLDFDRSLNDDWLFRAASRVRYLGDKNRVDFNQQFSFFQKVNDRVGMAYEVGAQGDDDHNADVNQYYTQVRARFRAYKKWLFLELRPQVVFRHDEDYDPSFRFSLRADVVFGARYRD